MDLGKFKIVPIEADDAQHNAARDWSHAKYGKPIGSDASKGCWDAMVVAAPELTEQEYDELIVAISNQLTTGAIARQFKDWHDANGKEKGEREQHDNTTG